MVMQNNKKDNEAKHLIRNGQIMMLGSSLEASYGMELRHIALQKVVNGSCWLIFSLQTGLGRIFTT